MREQTYLRAIQFRNGQYQYHLWRKQKKIRPQIERMPILAENIEMHIKKIAHLSFANVYFTLLLILIIKFNAKQPNSLILQSLEQGLDLWPAPLPKKVPLTVFNLAKNASDHATSKPSRLGYKGLPVKDVSRFITRCGQKTSGVSAGKICSINQKTCYLKAIEINEFSVDRRTNALLGLYNLDMLRLTLPVTIPNTYLVYEEGGKYVMDSEIVGHAEYYIASEQVSYFETANALKKQANRDFLKREKSRSDTRACRKSIEREWVVKYIREEGIASLAVAGTFFQDLVMNEGNWGYNRAGLVIVDVDHSPESLEEYLAEAARMPHNIGIDFSTNTIKMMLTAYKKMMSISPPSLHSSVNMSPSFYQTLLSSYALACEKTLEKIALLYLKPALNQPLPEINQFLAESLLASLRLIQNTAPQPSRYFSPQT